MFPSASHPGQHVLGLGEACILPRTIAASSACYTPELWHHDHVAAARQLRRQEETSRMPIILLTARVQEEVIARGFDAGADDYVRKPFSPQELGSRVQAALGR